MELDNEASSFLTLHQRLEFSCSNHQKSDPSKLSDTYRNTYLHLMQTTLAPSEIDGTHDTHRLKRVLSPLMSEANKYLDKYTQIVDKIDGTGLNNFAEGALALCSYHKNESMKWKTSLSVEKIFEMPCMQTVKTKESSVAAEEDCMITIQSSSSSDLESATKSHEPDAVQQNQVLMKQSSNPPTCSLVGQTVGSMEPASGTGTMASASMFPSGLSAFKNADTHARCGWQQSVVSNARNGSFQNQPGPGGGANGWNGYQPPHGTSMEYGDSRRSRNGVFQNQIPSRTGDEEQMGPAGYSSSSTRGKRSGKPWMKKDEEDDEDIDENDDGSNKQGPFRTAKQQLVINQQKKYGGRGCYGGYDRSQLTGASYGGTKKSLGTRRGPASKFVPPVLSRDSDENSFGNRSAASSRQQRQDSDTVDPDNPVDERLKGIEPKMIELINNEIMDNGARITWSDIAGLEFAKKTIQEIVVWPMLRPDIFTGLRGPPKGLLLFGPPGTGKTLIGKCVASQSKSTFFCISASTLTSKWVGEGEKMVRALFAVARCHQPAVVFIDEIDSLLSQRSDAEHESSRRIKTEFLVQLDGAATESEDRILVIGATNRPQEIDEAARRRFVKRLLIPLPEAVARRQIVMNLMSQQRSNLNDADIQAICDKTDGYSGADMTNLCREAALGPIRSIPIELMETITPDQVRPILYKDFEEALHQVRASVSSKDLELYTEWNKTYGSFGC